MTVQIAQGCQLGLWVDRIIIVVAAKIRSRRRRGTATATTSSRAAQKFGLTTLSAHLGVTQDAARTMNVHARHVIGQVGGRQGTLVGLFLLGALFALALGQGGGRG